MKSFLQVLLPVAVLYALTGVCSGELYWLFTLRGKSYSYEDLAGTSFARASEFADKCTADGFVQAAEIDRFARGTTVGPVRPFKCNDSGKFLQEVLHRAAQEMIDIAVMGAVFDEFLRDTGLSPESVVDVRSHDTNTRQVALYITEVCAGVTRVLHDKEESPKVYQSSALLQELFMPDQWEDLVRRHAQEIVAAVFLKTVGFPDFLREPGEPAPWFATGKRLFQFQELLFLYVTRNRQPYAEALEDLWGKLDCIRFRVRDVEGLARAEKSIGKFVDPQGQVSARGMAAANAVLAVSLSRTRFELVEVSRRLLASRYSIQPEAIHCQSSTLLAVDEDGWQEYVYVCSKRPKAYFADRGYDPRKNAFLRDFAFRKIVGDYFARLRPELTVRPGYEMPDVEALAGLLYIEPTKVIGNRKLEPVILRQP